MIREEKRPEISGVLKRDHCYFKWYLKIFSIVIHMNRHYKSSFFLLLTRYSIKNKICNSSQTELLYWLEVIVYVEKNGTYQVDEWIQLITVSYQKIVFERNTGGVLDHSLQKCSIALQSLKAIHICYRNQLHYLFITGGACLLVSK